MSCSVALLYGKYSVWRAWYSGLTGGVKGQGESERGSRERTGEGQRVRGSREKTSEGQSERGSRE